MEKNIIKKLLDGDFGLSKTFWLFGFFVVIVMTGTFFYFSAIKEIAFVPYLAYGAVVLIGVWNAAKKYPGDSKWADLAKGVVVYVFLHLSYLLVLWINEMFT